MACVQDCGHVVSGFELQLRYYIHFQSNTHGEGMNSLIYLAMGWVVSLLSYYKNGFSIE